MKTICQTILRLLALSIICHASITAQTAADSLLQRIDHYRSVDSFELYFSTYNKLLKEYKASPDRHELVVSVFDTTSLYRAPETETESASFRNFIKGYLYSYRKLRGRSYAFIDVATYYSKFVHDPVFLDKHALYIENQIATGYAELDDYDQAIYYYEKLIPGYEARGMSATLARVYGNLADAFKWNKDTVRWKVHLDKGLELAKETKDTVAYCAIYSRLFKYYIENEDPVAAEDLSIKFAKILAELDQSKTSLLRRADFEASLSQMHKDSGLYLQALESNIRAVDLSLAGEVDPRNAAKLLCKRAEIYLRMNQPEECRRVIDDAYKMLLGTQFSSPPSKQAIYLENTFVDLFTIDIELRQELYKKDPTAEQLEEIWYLYDQAIRVNEALNDQHLFSVCKFLSSANTDAIAERGIAFGLEILKKDKSDEVLSKIAALSHMSRNLVLDEKLSFNQSYFELKSLPAAKIDSLSTMYTYLSTQANTEAKRLEIKNEINSLVPREPQYESHLSTATLEYIRAAGDYYLFAEIENQPSIIHIGAVSDIDRLVETVRAELLGRKDILNSTHLRKLSEILLPVEISLPRQISIVADGDLSVFPFGIIYRNGKYLIQDHDILYAPRPKRSDRVAVKNILCYAPAYKSGDGVVALERSENGQLIHAATEVEVIASMLGSGVTVRKNDSFGRLVDQIRAVDVFHFAGHAAFDTSTAAIYIETVDGVDHWDFDNIFQYVFDLELVTVSACESGIGTYSNGDGAQSIARGFMGAGARSVAYSLWKVNDQSTVQIMTDFYKNLKAGQPKDVALSSAQRHFLETSSPQLRHPYYWAAFVIAGDPSSIVVKNRGVGPYLLGAAGILIILLITRKTIQQ